MTTAVRVPAFTEVEMRRGYATREHGVYVYLHSHSAWQFVSWVEIADAVRKSHNSNETAARNIALGKRAGSYP